jgi:hypothetical protein
VDTEFYVTGSMAVEILPGVRVSAGIAKGAMASVAIEAPQYMNIVRGKVYERTRSANPSK